MPNHLGCERVGSAVNLAEKKMKKTSFGRVGARQRGFTLIELVMVIVILGILSAIALPKFIDLSGQASLAAAQGVAGALTSGSAANFAAKKVGNPSAVALSVANVCVTGTLAPTLQGGFPTGYTATGTGDCTLATAADTVTCNVVGPSVTTTTTIYCAR